MTRAQERLARRIARALRGIEFDVALVSGRRCCALIEANGEVGGGPRVEVRHPDVERRGHQWLVAIVALDPVCVTYAVPIYRDPIERSVRRVVTAHPRFGRLPRRRHA